MAAELLDGEKLVKLEVLSESKTLFPNIIETIKATEALVKKDFKVSAVLDWELSTLGHPFADLGYFLYAHYIPYGERHGLKGSNLNELNIPNVDNLVNEYCKVRKIENFDPTFYVVLALFRSISILEGVYARFVNGNESSPTAKDIGKDVEPLANATFDIIKKL